MKPVGLTMLLVFLFNAGAAYLFFLCIWTGHPYNPNPAHFNKSIPNAENLLFFRNLCTVALSIVFFLSTCRQLYLLCEDCKDGDSFEICGLYMLAYMASTTATLIASLFIIHLMGVHPAWTFGAMVYLALMGIIGANGIPRDEYSTVLGIGYSLYIYAQDSKEYIERKESFKDSLNKYLLHSKF